MGRLTIKGWISLFTVIAMLPCLAYAIFSDADAVQGRWIALGITVGVFILSVALRRVITVCVRRGLCNEYFNP